MAHVLYPFGWSDRWAALAATAADELGRTDTAPGRVVRHDGVAVLVAGADGEQRSLPWLGALDPAPVVGDWVLATGEIVVAVLARSSLLRRRDPHGDVEQALVANLDMVLVVCGLDRRVKPGRIQRVTTLAWDAGAVPVVVLTKADAVDDSDALAAAVAAANPGVDVLVTSSATGAGVDEVRAACVERTVVLLGESGAGKSSLANAMAGTPVAATGAVRAGEAKGRHTTTARQLHLLPRGGVLVDTPGIRAVGLWADEAAVAATFDDVESLAGGCRFGDCAHAGEPGCAVTAAVDDGALDPARLEAWRVLRLEAASAARRADEHARRTYERNFARMVKHAPGRKGRR